MKAESGTTIKGINITRLPARDAYGIALQLLELMFSKEELAGSLLFKSKKSAKPGLYLHYIDKRFGEENSDLRVESC